MAGTPISDVDIASANLGWMVAQLLLGTMVTKKVLTAQDAKGILEYCENHYKRMNNPQRTGVKKQALAVLEPILQQYSVPPENQKH
jgi:hypothetical protein